MGLHILELGNSSSLTSQQRNKTEQNTLTKITFRSKTRKESLIILVHFFPFKSFVLRSDVTLRLNQIFQYML